MTELSFEGMRLSLQACVVAVVRRAIESGRIDRFGSWSMEVREAVETRLFDLGYGCYAAGPDRLTPPMEWKGETR